MEEYLLRLITRARKMSKQVELSSLYRFALNVSYIMISVLFFFFFFSVLQRVVIEKTKHQIVITRDIRKEIASINQKAEEWDRRQAEVAEELLPQRKVSSLSAFMY